MSQIHILDNQDHTILDYITAKNIISDDHKKSKEDTLETYNFITFADKRFSEFLEKRNRVVIPDEDDTLREFVIFEAAKYRDTEGYKARVYTHASYLELKKASILYPDAHEGTASQLGGRALNDTGWQMGIVESKGTRTLTIDSHTNPFAFLKRIAKEFDLELRFRVEHDGNKIIGRYVDLLEQVGEWRGREVEFGKDLDGIERVEKQDIVTALLGLGPEDEDGNRLEVLVEDEDALKRWGRLDEHGNLRHLIEPYEIQSSRTEMTESEARQYTRTALNKRLDTQVTYETTIIDLENVPGMENKKIRFGDTIKIKDTKFVPPLYLEARVFEQTRSIKSKAKKNIKLGDYIEHTEEEVNAIWKQLQSEIRKRVSKYEMMEYTYDKLTIDDKDEQTYEDGKTFAEATGVKAEENAKDYADEQDEKLESSVKDYADDVSEEHAESALSQAKQYAVAKEVYEIEMEKIADDIEDRAPLEYVDGEFKVIKDDLDKFDTEIEKKADGDTVYTISEVNNMINNTVSVTKYEEDMDGIVSDIESQGTRIGQNEKTIGLKADESYVDSVENSLETKIGNVEVKADEIEISVSEVKTDLDDVDGRVEKSEGRIEVLTDEVSLKASSSSVDSLEDRVEDAESELKVLPGEIKLKADASKVDGIDDRLGSAEVIIDGLESEIKLKADLVDIEGMLRAVDLEVRKDLKFGGELVGPSGTFGKVTVDEGDIIFKDPVTDSKYSIISKRNLIKDHSFEMVLPDWDKENADSYKYNWVDIKSIEDREFAFWETKGKPKVTHALDRSDAPNSFPLFGIQAAVVRSGDYIRQYFNDGIGSGVELTFSAYFKRQWNQAPGQPRIEIDFIRHHDDGSFSRERLLNDEFPTVPNDYTPVRHSSTFTIPNDVGPYDEVDLKLSGVANNDNWVQVDGVQLVEGSMPTTYDPEDGVHQIVKGNYIPELQPDALWVGDLFLMDVHTIEPSKKLNDCSRGWILQWQRYDGGKKDNNYQFTHIPKATLRNGEGNGHRLTMYRGGLLVEKYIYISDRKIVGREKNGRDNNRQLSLTGIYEY